MNSARGWYWLAAGVLALGFNGLYVDGGARIVHELVDRSTLAAAEKSSAAMRYLAIAEMMLGRPESSQHTQLAMARVEGRVMRLQAEMARREVERARADLQDAQLAWTSNAGAVHVVCPRVPKVKVNIPEPPQVEIADVWQLKSAAKSP